ncbi:MAG: hypothetical protein QOE70_3604 [Chthoniobacter sp.]|jgi:hypothetical protein|nr:hypothetical protein [Chthoniobacter sp.]
MNANPPNPDEQRQGSLLRFPELKAVAFLLCLAPALAFADGIPFDREKHGVTVPHETFVLTEAQGRELAARHRVTLTSPQHELLTKRFARFPGTINEILPWNWGDCTCAVGHPYAILLPGGTSIAVTHAEADFTNRYGVIPSSMSKPKSAWSRFWRSLLGSHSP